LHKTSIRRETDGVKNVRSSGSARSFISGYQLIQEFTEREFLVYVIQSNPAAFTDFFSTFVSLSIATLGFPVADQCLRGAETVFFALVWNHTGFFSAEG